MMWYVRNKEACVKKQNCRIFISFLREKLKLILHKCLFYFAIPNSVEKIEQSRLYFYRPDSGGTRIARHGVTIYGF